MPNPKLSQHGITWDSVQSNLHYLERLLCFFCTHLIQDHITTNIIVCSIIVILGNCMILELVQF